MLEKVLVPLNLHEPISRVLSMCRFLQNIGIRQVVLLHAGAEKGRPGKINTRRLQEYAQHLKPEGLETEVCLRSGPIQMEVVREAYEWEVDLISFPFKKKNWLKRTILGSNVKDVIRQSTIPVFVYKESKASGKEHSFRVLYPTSLQWKEDTIIDYIKNNPFDAEQIDFLYVGRRAPDPVVEQKRSEKAQTRLQNLREKCALTSENSDIVLTLGSPRRQIVRVARKVNADLLFLGKADSVSGSAPVLGSTAEAVSYNAPCSVLIIPRVIIPTQPKEEQV